jgi:site-specific DNA-methyltransferase (adenine-specific)
MEEGEAYKREAKDKEKGYGTGTNTHGYGFSKNKPFLGGENHGTRYPKSILHASRNFSAQQTVHPTQKPTNVLNWLIMTYSNPGDTVMDFTMGSGGCGVSAKLTGRNFIGIEQDLKYFKIAESRITQSETNTVTPNDKQLSTQLPKGTQTTPDKKYEQGVLESIRNPDKNQDSKDNTQFNNLFEEQE